MICEYAGEKYTPKLYKVTEVDGKWNKDCWFKEAKPSIRAKNPFANLPYIIDGDNCVCQTNACLSYLGKKFDLYGKDEYEIMKVDQCLDQIMDLRNDMVKLFYSSKDSFETGIDKFITKTAPSHLEKMENWLTQNKTVFLVSDSPCVADFHLWELIDQLEMFVKHYKKESLIKDKENLENFYSKMRGLEELSDYFKGDLYKLPVNNPHAYWK